MKNNLTIGAIIQARMLSRRLPGKVMTEVNGKPLLEYLLRRLGRASTIKKIVLATTTVHADDVIFQFAKKRNVLCYRGSEGDVLERYYLAATEYQIDPIVRITADCPLIDPKIVDQLVNIYLEEKADYVYTGPTFSEGLDCEVFSYRALSLAHQNAKKISEREHVTRFFHNHQEKFKNIAVKNISDDSKYRFTVDEPEDFEVVKVILESFPDPTSGSLDGETIKSFLKNHPEVMKKNAHVIRNEGLLISLQNEVKH